MRNRQRSGPWRNSDLQAPVDELSYNGRNPPVVGTRDEHDEIVRILKVTSGRVGGPDGAAVRMGMNRTTLLSRMKKFGIDPANSSCPLENMRSGTRD